MTLKALLAELQVEYLSTFPSKCKVLNEFFSDGKLEELQMEYHKLKGTGRTYGLPEVSRLGETLEALCNECRESLPEAVPASIRILGRIRESRVAEREHELDIDRDFVFLLRTLGMARATRKPA